MKKTTLLLEWQSPRAVRQFRRGISLHGHTLHSKECLDFIYRFARSFRPLQVVLERGKRSYRLAQGRELDLHRGWWTPPVSPQEAWALERKQIEIRHGLEATVSLTDHDSIEACLALQMLEQCSGHAPISVEWTVPFRGTFFHLGIHNLPPAEARPLMKQMAALTSSPDENTISELLANLHQHEGMLTVFNHPMWDEKGIGKDLHVEHVLEFLKRNQQWLHAIELNGMRPWPENLQALDLAKAHDIPVISGGDRHTTEPNTIINLTNARNFDEFAEEVRSSGRSHLMVTTAYRESFNLRMLRNASEVFADCPKHGLGWRHWSERVFYRLPDDSVVSLFEVWGGRVPGYINSIVWPVQWVQQPGMVAALRVSVMRQQEVRL